MNKIVVTAGWNNWGNPENEKKAYYADYGSRGPGAAKDKRVAWSHRLTKEAAQQYTLP